MRLYKPLAVAVLFFVLLIISVYPVFADTGGVGDGDDLSQQIITPISADLAEEGIEAIAITVIIPPAPDRQPPQTQATTPTRRVFPINVAEGYNYDGVRELVRIYELLPNESPEWINTDSFTRNGYYYQIADIVRQVNVSLTNREHTEVVRIPSSTNNLATVINGLYPTMDFVDEYGYAGVLHLDIRSIEMTQDGTRSSSRTVSQTREYPHLSTPDLALIPQTITANGRTYTLNNVDWRTNTSTPIDFNSVPQTFTAVATYTRTATSTVSTGYTTVAAYSGTLTRVSIGDVRFVATFIGTPIVSPIVNRPAVPATQNPEQGQVNGTYEATNDVVTGQSETDTGTASTNIQNSDDNGDNGNYNEHLAPTIPSITNTEVSQESQQNGQSVIISPLLMLLSAFAGAIITTLVAMVFIYKKKADTLEKKFYSDSGKALSSRMASIIHHDRQELADNTDDIDGVDEVKYEDKYTLDHSGVFGRVPSDSSKSLYASDYEDYEDFEPDETKEQDENSDKDDGKL